MPTRMLVLLAALLATVAAQPETPARPNVIVIMTDDQGYGDFGFAGNPVIRTPNLDRLAAESARVERFYVCPVCAPTRASLMTGRWHMRTRVIDTYIGRAMMDPDEVTMAEVLGQAGYRTGIFGKWHLGDCYPMRPIDQGFQRSLVHRGGGIGQPSDPVGGERKYTDPVLFLNGQRKQTKGYCTDLYFEAATSFINEASASKSPFFAYIPTNAPHGPFHDVPDELYREYLADPKLDTAFRASMPPARRKKQRDRLARIFAMITNVDENVGRLLKHLDDRGLAKNTLVIFLNDNGPNGARFTCGLRGNKGDVHEGGIRSPLLVRWPGRVKPGRMVKGPGAHIDVLPTVLAACGVRVPKDVRLDGKDLWPALTGAPTPGDDRVLVIQVHRGDRPQEARHAAVLSGKWKLVIPSGFGGENGRPGTTWSLHDLDADPGESRDVSSTHPDVRKHLLAAYRTWFQDVTSTRSLTEPPRIHLGHEQPCVLTRQDWRHLVGRAWGQHSHGEWFVVVPERQVWKLRVRLQKPVTAGTYQLEFGNLKRAGKIPDGAKVFDVELKDLRPGPTELRMEIVTAQRKFGPYQVEVTSE